MSSSHPGALQVRAKTQQVVDRHYDPTPEKPLYLLIPGGLIALISLALIVYIGYISLYKGDMSTGQGLTLMGILAPFYIGAVFMFSYGYELYNLPKALRLTAIVVFITLAAVVIVAVLFVVFSIKGDSKSSSRSSSKSSSFDSDPSPAPSSSYSGSRGAGWLGGVGPIFVDSGSHGGTVTREIVREVPAEPAAPQPIQCPYCGRSYIPSETGFACPNCGAASPNPASS